MPALKITSGILLIGISLISCNQNKQAQQNEQAKQVNVLDSSNKQKQLPIWTKFIPDSGLVKGMETVTPDTNSLIGGSLIHGLQMFHIQL